MPSVWELGSDCVSERTSASIRKDIALHACCQFIRSPMKASDAILGTMDRDALVRKNEKKMSDCMSRLDAAAYDLGFYAYRSLDIPSGRKFSDAIRDKLMTLESAVRDEKELKKFCMDYEQNKAELSFLDSRLSESSVREKELSLRLGAALYEQCSFGLLDRSAFAPVYRDAEKERNLESTAPSGFIPKIGTAIEKKKMEKGKEARLMSYAELAMLQSAPVYGNPLEILSALKALSAESAAMRIKRDKLSEYISGHRGEYLKASKGGLDTQRERVRKCDDEARSSIVSYGTYLYEKGPSWISESTPDDVIAIIDKMKFLRSQQAAIASEREDIAKAAKADDVQMMIEIEEDKAAMLRKEKADIEREIAEIEAKIAGLRGRLENLSGRRL